MNFGTRPRVAVTTWARTGEVNSSCAQAASSLPGPTNRYASVHGPGPASGNRLAFPARGVAPEDDPEMSSVMADHERTGTSLGARAAVSA
jgi:hypothetical protein